MEIAIIIIIIITVDICQTNRFDCSPVYTRIIITEITEIADKYY